MRLLIPISLSIALLLQQVLAVPIANNNNKYGDELSIVSKELLYKREGDNNDNSYHYYQSSDDNDNGDLVNGQFDIFTWNKWDDYAEEDFEFEIHEEMILQITGFEFNGDMFEIFDRDKSLGKTSEPNKSHNGGGVNDDVHCNDPEQALKDDRYSKGQILLPAGCHKITIKILHEDHCEGRGAIRLIPIRYHANNWSGNTDASSWGGKNGDSHVRNGNDNNWATHKDGKYGDSYVHNTNDNGWNAHKGGKDGYNHVHNSYDNDWATHKGGKYGDSYVHNTNDNDWAAHKGGKDGYNHVHNSYDNDWATHKGGKDGYNHVYNSYDNDWAAHKGGKNGDNHVHNSHNGDGNHGDNNVVYKYKYCRSDDDGDDEDCHDEYE